jgi:hypothetical protein
MKKYLILFLASFLLCVLIVGYPVSAIANTTININPIGDKHVGDLFTVTAQTNLPAGSDILVQIYSSTTTGARGLVKVINNNGNMNQISFDVDGSTFKPGIYTVIMNSMDQNVSGNIGFNIVSIPSSTQPKSLAEKIRDQNIIKITNIAAEYHKIHTYSLPDMFVCADMAQDVWDIVETQNISAIIRVGKIQDVSHAWVVAEVSPGEWISIETTGGYLVCANPNICAVDNPRYYTGLDFNSPKELQDYLDKLKHPCPLGYDIGADKLCHAGCGNGYCTGNSVCANGQCINCSSGYVLLTDLHCHKSGA